MEGRRNKQRRKGGGCLGSAEGEMEWREGGMGVRVGGWVGGSEGRRQV